jgi:hypothetical protein
LPNQSGTGEVNIDIVFANGRADSKIADEIVGNLKLMGGYSVEKLSDIFDKDLSQIISDKTTVIILFSDNFCKDEEIRDFLIPVWNLYDKTNFDIIPLLFSNDDEDTFTISDLIKKYLKGHNILELPKETTDSTKSQTRLLEPLKITRDNYEKSIPRIICRLRNFSLYTVPILKQEISKEIKDKATCPKVFISAASQDYSYAKKLFNYLKGKNIDVFLADRAVLLGGDSEYFTVIGKEILSATHMIVISSQIEHFSKRWVEFEYKSFIIEILNKRKVKGTLLVLTAGKLNPNNIPHPLNIYQGEPFNPKKFDDLLKYLKSKKIPDDIIVPPRPLDKRLIIAGIVLTIIVISIFFLVTNSPSILPPSNAEIEFTQIPLIGTSAVLKGKVTNMSSAEYQTHKVVPYIYVKGWWGPKPYATEVVNIRSDGTWEANIVTGMYDKDATEIAAILVPSSVSSPYLTGIETFPPEDLKNYPITYAER